MNPRFIRIQDIHTREWHYINVNHVTGVTETTKPSTAPHWDSATNCDAYVTIKTIDGNEYESDTFSAEQLVRRLTREKTEWSRVVEKLDLLTPYGAD